MRLLTIVLLIGFVGPVSSQDIRPQQSKNETAQNHEQGSTTSQNSLPPAGVTFSPIINVSTAKHGSEPSHCATPKAWKEWSSFGWCRVNEWIDAERVIAVFTVILGIATWKLWRATDRLVEGADTAAQRQQRAYVSVEPSDVANFGTQNRLGVFFNLKNHGGTPASEISHDFGMAYLPNPLPAGFEYPTPTRQLDTNSTLFPNASLPIRLFHDADLSDDEINMIERDERRFHFWGVTHYRDTFGVGRTTQFRASFGGPNFAETTANFRKGRLGPDGKPRPGWFWDWSPGHNQAT